jgi:glycosyltransferase involved in cell wall biosynthesis
LYDNFGKPVSKTEARTKLGLNVSDKIILFFGFIRKYKGLDILLEAMNDDRIQKSNIKLLIAGEFYGDRKLYDDLIQQLHLSSQLILRTDFIADSEVRYYLSAADFVIQPYRNATQSGVTPLAYHFEKPMLVTNVGGLPDLVPDGKVGLVAEPVPAAIATQILRLYELTESFFLPQLVEEKKKYDWKILVDVILRLVS